MNNISLLAIGISALFMLNVVSYSLGQALIKAFQITVSDISIESYGGTLDKDVLIKVRNTDGVAKTYAVYAAGAQEVKGSSSKIGQVLGYNEDGFKTFMNLDYNQDQKSIYNNFDDGRNAVIGETIRKTLNVNIGDVITIKTKIGYEDYKITGSFNSLSNGTDIIIPERYVKQDFKVSNIGQILLLTSKDPNVVAKKLNDIFKGQGLSIMTWKQMEDESIQSINVMLSIIKVFPIVAMCIGAFGVLNNFIISFIERRRYLAIFASVGMSKKQTIKMLFLESFSVGLIGAFSGISGGVICTYVIACIFKTINFPIQVIYQPQVFITSIVLGILITIVASIVPSIKSSKLNIIEAIKFE